MRKTFGIVAIIGVAMLAAPLPAVARQAVTYGDVRAQFEAVETGGAVIRSNKGFETTIPPADALQHSIRPIAPFFEGRHYCVLDWQLITLAIFFPPELKGLAAETEYTFIIDKVPTPAMETTAVKTLLNPEFFGLPQGWWWRAWGILSAPGALSVGRHSLAGSSTDPVFGTIKDPKITFYIDSAGEGACL